MMRTGFALPLAMLLAASASGAATPTVSPTTVAVGMPLAVHVGGRVERIAAGYRRQWPSTYFEAAFWGREVLMKLGAGDVILRVTVDGRPIAPLVKPGPGVYRIHGLAAGDHIVRADVASESQAAPTVFGGFYAAPRTRGLAPPARARQIDFIGDSHIVGYGNRATKRDCTEAEVWATTDTSQAMPAQLARHYDADYQVNAISGRGIVRNYDGMAATTLPAAYPFTLFDRRARYRDPAWHPQLIVIALGTNDFTTPLRPGEPWPNRAALHTDFERTYIDFVHRIHADDPGARILLWATDMAGGEIAAEVAKVADRLAAQGEPVAFVPVRGLAFDACHAHPSIADDGRIASAITAYLDGQPGLWAQR